MSELNLKQIIDRLNAEFTGDTRKIVFWYDDKAEFAEDIESVELEKREGVSAEAGQYLHHEAFSGAGRYHNQLSDLCAVYEAGCQGKPPGGHHALLQAVLC